MRFRFDPDLDYQTDAIQAIVRLFAVAIPPDLWGFPEPQRSSGALQLPMANGVVGNALALTDAHDGAPLPPSLP
jgi:hypothetical protein